MKSKKINVKSYKITMKSHKITMKSHKIIMKSKKINVNYKTILRFHCDFIGFLGPRRSFYNSIVNIINFSVL